MILTTIDHLNDYIGSCPALAAVENFVKTHTDLQPGRYELDNGAYAMVKEGMTKEEASVRFEAHRRYVDVHYLVSGNERIVWRMIDGMPVCQPYNEEKDNIFFSGMEGCAIDMAPGELMVCFPSDGHKANQSADGQAPYKKIVFKLPLLAGSSKSF